LMASYPFYTPYQFAGNKPIAAIDLDGLEEELKFDIQIFGYEDAMKIHRTEGLSEAVGDIASAVKKKFNDAHETSDRLEHAYRFSTGEQVGVWGKSLFLFEGYWSEFGDYSSASDISVIKDGVLPSGVEATSVDKGLSYIFVFLPVAGHQVKKFLKKSRKGNLTARTVSSRAFDDDIPVAPRIRKDGDYAVVYLRKFGSTMKIGTAKRNTDKSSLNALETYLSRYSDDANGAFDDLAQLAVVPSKYMIAIEQIFKNKNAGKVHNKRNEGANLDTKILKDARDWLDKNIPDWNSSWDVDNLPEG